VPAPSPADTFSASIQLQFRNASGVVVGTTTVKTYTQAATTAGAWQAFATAAPVTAPAGTISAAVVIVGTSLKAQVFLDGFMLQPAP
jgi:hypothetical protein